MCPLSIYQIMYQMCVMLFNFNVEYFFLYCTVFLPIS